MKDRISIMLYGAAIRMALRGMCHEYARLSVIRIATVRRAPVIKPEEEARWRDLRDSLRSIGGDLPDVGEPAWPVTYLASDDIVTKSKIVDVAGLRFRQVLKTKKKPGAKPKPTYSELRVHKHAEQWRDAFLTSIGAIVSAADIRGRS